MKQANQSVKAATSPAQQLLIQTVAKIDHLALGVAVGTVFGAGVFLATNFLIFKGGARIGPTLALLNQYFFGYSVTFAGSFVGLFYGFVSGFLIGWSLALTRNFVIAVYLHVVKFKGRIAAVDTYLDY